jgi:hypothetical protein
LVILVMLLHSQRGKVDLVKNLEKVIIKYSVYKCGPMLDLIDQRYIVNPKDGMRWPIYLNILIKRLKTVLYSWKC